MPCAMTPAMIVSNIMLPRFLVVYRYTELIANRHLVGCFCIPLSFLYTLALVRTIERLVLHTAFAVYLSRLSRVYARLLAFLFFLHEDMLCHYISGKLCNRLFWRCIAVNCSIAHHATIICAAIIVRCLLLLCVSSV